MRVRIEKLETSSNNKNIRDMYKGINDLKKGHQPGRNIVKDENGDRVAGSHSIKARWRNYISPLFNVNGVKDFRQAEIRTEEPLVPEPCSIEVEPDIDKLKSHKSLGINQIPSEILKVVGGQ